MIIAAEVTLPAGLLRKSEFIPKYVRMSEERLVALMERGHFPKPIESSPPYLRLWKSDDVAAYLRGEYPPKSDQ